MTSLTQVSFLEPDIEQIRHQLRGILDSYSHDWDVFAELAQNAVDSIKLASPTKGHIDIVVNAAIKEVKFSDNGTGIDPASIAKLLRPFGTTKYNSSNQVGSKGVGLTFILFSTLEFELETHHVNGSVRATVTGANTWVSSSLSKMLEVSVTNIEPGPRGTTIRLKFPDSYFAFWEMSAKQIVFWLRTRTAIGDTGHIWGKPLACDVKFFHTSLSGTFQEFEFECDYLLPTETISKSDKIDLDEYVGWRGDTDRTDGDKRKKLFNKVVYSVSQKVQSGREIKIWSCFMPSRTMWQSISKSHELVGAGDDEGLLFDGFSGGLYTSSRGMPTGIQLPMKTAGMAGYLPNFFVLLEDPSLSFDIGRKAIQTRQQGMLRQIAAEQFNRYLKDTVKYTGGTSEIAQNNFDREDVFNEIDDLPELSSHYTKFSRRPNRQEATVAAIFYELMGAGKFENLKPLVSGYKNKYDLFARVQKKTKVIEFKYDLSALVKDFDDAKKMFDEIDVAVVWDVSETDREFVELRGLSLNPTSSGIPPSVTVPFPLSHFVLSIEYAKPIEVVCIRRMVDPD